MTREIKLGNKLVGDGQPAYIIAEIGINHNGDLDLAKKMIGFQPGAVCVVDGHVTGCQASVVNYGEKVNGFQLGAVNYSKSNGLQIGVVNVIEDGWLPFSFIFNVSFK